MRLYEMRCACLHCAGGVRTPPYSEDIGALGAEAAEPGPRLCPVTPNSARRAAKTAFK